MNENHLAGGLYHQTRYANARAVICYLAVRAIGYRGVEVAMLLRITPACVVVSAKRGETLVEKSRTSSSCSRWSEGAAYERPGLLPAFLVQLGRLNKNKQTRLGRCSIFLFNYGE